MSAVSVSSIVHAAQPIDIFEAKLFEDIDTSFVENASLTWTPPHSTMTHGQQGKRQWSRWPQKRSTKCWFGDPIGEVYCNCFSRWSREDLPSVSSHLEVRRAPVKESFGGGSTGYCSRSAWVVFVVLSYRRPHRILPFLFQLVSLECSPLCLQMGCSSYNSDISIVCTIRTQSLSLYFAEL